MTAHSLVPRPLALQHSKRTQTPLQHSKRTQTSGPSTLQEDPDPPSTLQEDPDLWPFNTPRGPRPPVLQHSKRKGGLKGSLGMRRMCTVRSCDFESCTRVTERRLFGWLLHVTCSNHYHDKPFHSESFGC